MNGDLRVFSPYNPLNQFGEWDGYQLKYPVDPEPGLHFTDSIYREEMVYFLDSLGPQSDIAEVDDDGYEIISHCRMALQLLSIHRQILCGIHHKTSFSTDLKKIGSSIKKDLF